MEPDERDAVIAALQAALESFGKSMNELKKERDEAIADRDILRIDAQKEDVHHDRLLNELDRVYKERDEARNAIIGWENKWKCAIEMAAKAEVDRDNAQDQLDVAMKVIKILEDQIYELKS